MNEEVLDWKGALAGGCERAEYVGRLREFVARERETAARVEQALKSGHDEEARAVLHDVRGTAAGLGARALAAAALELEMAVRAGADTARALGHFSTAHMDALLSMQAFLSQ